MFNKTKIYFTNLKTIILDIFNVLNQVKDKTPYKNVIKLNAGGEMTIEEGNNLIVKENLNRTNIHIQNTGTQPCMISLGVEASNNNYHFILAPDTFIKMGNGGSLKLDDWNGSVYAYCTSPTGTTLAVVEY